MGNMTKEEEERERMNKAGACGCVLFSIFVVLASIGIAKGLAKQHRERLENIVIETPEKTKLIINDKKYSIKQEGDTYYLVPYSTPEAESDSYQQR